MLFIVIVLVMSLWRGCGPNICLMANNFAKLQKIVRYFLIRVLKMLSVVVVCGVIALFGWQCMGNFVVSFGARVLR